MASYDPLHAPDATAWLGMPETERMALVEAFHKRARIMVPRLNLHVVAHVTVENQVALGVEAVTETLERLQAEGLDRHEAVHAVGLVLFEHLQQQLTEPTADPNPVYEASLRRLTAEQFRET